MEKDINIKIYKLIDPITDEVRYIGKTIQTLNNRLRRHVYDANRLTENKSHKNNWIRLLLKKNLKPKIELIEENIDIDKWGEVEIMYIKKFRGLGYDLTNNTNGGEGSHGVILSEETKKKISEANKGRVVSESIKKYLSDLHKGKKLSEETKKKISQSKKGKKLSDKHKKKLSLINSGELNNFYGKTHDKITRDKMSKIKKNKPSNRAKKVKQLDIYDNVIKIWNSSMEAGRELNISNKGIWKVCKGIKKTYKGYKWQYV